MEEFSSAYGRAEETGRAEYNPMSAGWNQPSGAGGAPASGRSPKGSPGSDAAIVGVARAVQQRAEQEDVSQFGGIQVWTFRIDRYDQAGDRLQPVPVELRSRHFHGTLTEGDRVLVAGRWSPGTTLRPREVHNLTTGSRLIGEGRINWSRVFVAFTLAWALFIAFLILTHLGG